MRSNPACCVDTESGSQLSQLPPIPSKTPTIDQGIGGISGIPGRDQPDEWKTGFQFQGSRDRGG